MSSVSRRDKLNPTWNHLEDQHIPGPPRTVCFMKVFRYSQNPPKGMAPLGVLVQYILFMNTNQPTNQPTTSQTVSSSTDLPRRSPPHNWTHPQSPRNCGNLQTAPQLRREETRRFVLPRELPNRSSTIYVSWTRHDVFRTQKPKKTLTNLETLKNIYFGAPKPRPNRTHSSELCVFQKKNSCHAHFSKNKNKNSPLWKSPRCRKFCKSGGGKTHGLCGAVIRFRKAEKPSWPVVFFQKASRLGGEKEEKPKRKASNLR